MSAPLAYRTACGLYVVAGTDPRALSGFTWQQPVLDLQPHLEDTALRLIQHDLMQACAVDRATGGHAMPTGIAFATVHDGAHDRVPGLDHADPPVSDAYAWADDDDRRAGRARPTWTVCGILQRTWRRVCMHVTAASPQAAYLHAWRSYQRHDDEWMLLAAVHPGTARTLTYFTHADPWADGDTDMAATLARWGVPA